MYQDISLTSNEYASYLWYQVPKASFVTSVNQASNPTAYTTLSSASNPWILDYGASDHISSKKECFSPLAHTSTLPIVTLAYGSKIVAKDIGIGSPLPSLSLNMFFMFLTSLQLYFHKQNCSRIQTLYSFI